MGSTFEMLPGTVILVPEKLCAFYQLMSDNICEKVWNFNPC
jgi:hypothetical protein